MRKFIRESNELNMEESSVKVNKGLIDRSTDAPMVEYLVDTWKSAEIVENLEFLDYEYNEGEKKIDMAEYIQERAATGTSEEGEKHAFINDNRVGELTVRFKCKCAKVESGGEEPEYEDVIIEKKMLTLISDEDGYIRVNGKKKYLIYQMVDASTYNGKDRVILRTMLSVSVKRHHREIETVDGTSYDAVSFSINMFNKERDLLPFYFAEKGFFETLVYMGCEDVIKVVPEVDNDKECIYFKISSKLYLKVVKDVFEDISFVRSMVSMILDVCSNRMKMTNLVDKVGWVEKIGAAASTGKCTSYYDKGCTFIKFIKRMLDITHQKLLAVHSSNKTDIFAVLRWMMMNFVQLRKKDNLDLNNKILRYNSFVGALFTFYLSDRINRAINIGSNKFTRENAYEFFNFPGGILISLVSKSGLLVYDDRVNDLDIISKLRYSNKGINSLGNKNERKITPRFRALHPSHLGKVDICCIGNSDPGTSGILSPFVKTNGLAFSLQNEPETASFELAEAVNAYKELSTSESNKYYNGIEDFFEKREERELNIMGKITAEVDKIEFEREAVATPEEILEAEMKEEL